MHFIHTNKSFLLISALIMAGLILQACGASPETTPQETPLAVQTELAGTEVSIVTHSFPASVISAQEARLSTIVMGTITMLDVNEGDRVSRGQVIARINDNQIRAQLMQIQAAKMQAAAGYELAAAAFRRITNLYEQESATRHELDEATAGYNMAKAQLEMLEASEQEVQEMLAYTVIRAPFEGVVSRKFMRAGDLAAPGQPVVTLSSPGLLKIRAHLPENLIRELTAGETIRYSVPAAGIEMDSVPLTRVNSSGDQMSRQFSAEAVLPDAHESGIRPGMFATLHLSISDEPAIFVPQSALVHRGQLTGLYAVTESGQAVLRWVRTGRAHEGRVEIVSGLRSGERYISVLDTPVRQGQRVSL